MELNANYQTMFEMNKHEVNKSQNLFNLKIN